MVTLGIELCDEGVLAFTKQDGKEGALLKLEEDALASPGYIYQRNATSFVCGEAAERLSKLYPLDSACNFWERLSLKTSELTGKEDIPLFSELAYHHLKYIWERVQALVPSIGKVAFAVPSTYLQEDSDREEKIGLFLGMAADLKLPLVGILDMACASLLTQLKTITLPETGFLHIDIHQDTTLINLLKLRDGLLEQQNAFFLPRLGYTHILQKLTEKLAHQFLYQTAFDVTEDRKIEQTFFQKSKNLLALSNLKSENVLELDDLGRTRQISTSREDIVTALQDFSQTIVTALCRVAHNTGSSKSPLGHVILSERAARLPGLEEQLREADLIPILKLKAGTAAEGAADYGQSQPLVESLEVVPLVSSINVGKTSISKEESHPQIGTKVVEGPTPSHIVLEGIAYPILSEGFWIGAPPLGDRGGLSLAAKAQNAEIEIPVRLYWNGNTLKVAREFPSGLLLNGFALEAEAKLEVGDTLTLTFEQKELHFLLIHCSS